MQGAEIEDSRGLATGALNFNRLLAATVSALPTQSLPRLDAQEQAYLGAGTSPALPARGNRRSRRAPSDRDQGQLAWHGACLARTGAENAEAARGGEDGQGP